MRQWWCQFHQSKEWLSMQYDILEKHKVIGKTFANVKWSGTHVRKSSGHRRSPFCTIPIPNESGDMGNVIRKTYSDWGNREDKWWSIGKGYSDSIPGRQNHWHRDHYQKHWKFVMPIADKAVGITFVDRKEYMVKTTNSSDHRQACKGVILMPDGIDIQEGDIIDVTHVIGKR